MAKARNAKKSEGFNRRTLLLSRRFVILLKLVELTVKATVKIESIMAGSAIEDTIISLLPPIPPNALPVSSEVKTRKNLARANKYIISIISPVKFKGTCDDKTGTSNEIIKIEMNVTYGVALKIQEDVSETTASLRSNFIRL